MPKPIDSVYTVCYDRDIATQAMGKGTTMARRGNHGDYIITVIENGKLVFWGGIYSWVNFGFAQRYATWKRANAAIERQQKLGRWLRNVPMYCTVEELEEMTNDNWQPKDITDAFWRNGEAAQA